MSEFPGMFARQLEAEETILFRTHKPEGGVEGTVKRSRRSRRPSATGPPFQSGAEAACLRRALGDIRPARRTPARIGSGGNLLRKRNHRDGASRPIRRQL